MVTRSNEDLDWMKKGSVHANLPMFQFDTNPCLSGRARSAHSGALSKIARTSAIMVQKCSEILAQTSYHNSTSQVETSFSLSFNMGEIFSIPTWTSGTLPTKIVGRFPLADTSSGRLTNRARRSYRSHARSERAVERIRCQI